MWNVETVETWILQINFVKLIIAIAMVFDCTSAESFTAAVRDRAKKAFDLLVVASRPILQLGSETEVSWIHHGAVWSVKSDVWYVHGMTSD